MAVKIEAGKSYKTRGGEKVGPMLPNDFPQDSEWAWMAKGRPCGQSWRSDGSYTYTKDDPLDIISEWPSEGPVSTVTRKEIVPGRYGCVTVKSETNGSRVQLEIETTCDGLKTWYDATELRAAAAVLIELAEALEE